MSLQWRKWLFFLLLPVLIAIALFTARFKTDLSAFFVAGDNAEQILLASEMQSGTLSSRYLLSIGAVGQATVSSEFINRLVNVLKQIDGVVDVWKPGQDRMAADTLQAVYRQHGARMFSRRPEVELQDLLSESGLQQRASLLKQALLSPQGGVIKKIALQDPLLLSLTGFQTLAGQMQQILKTDSRYQNLILQTAMSGLDVQAQRQIQQRIIAALTGLNQASGQEYRLEMTGVPIFAAATQQLIEGDITRVSVLSSIALSLLFLLIFRSFGALFRVGSILLAVITVSVLATQLVFGYVHGMTLAIGTTLVGICIDYPIHGLVHAQPEPVAQRLPVIARIWPSMLLGGATTLVGYLALGFSGYPGFQQIAVYAGTGILVSLLLTRYVLPGLILSTGSTTTRILLVNRWAAVCSQHRGFLLIVLTLLTGVALSGLNSLHWIEDLQQLTPELDQLKANDQAIRSRMISSIEPGRFVLVTGNTTETALQKAEQVYQHLDQLKHQGVLSDYFGLYPWLLSKKQQLHNEKLLQAGLTEEKRVIWQQALKQQGLSVKRLGGIDYAAADPLTLEQVFASPVKRLIDSQIIIAEQQTLIMIWLAEHQPEVLRAAFAESDDVQYFSQRDLLNQLAGDYRNRAQVTLVIGLGIIVLLLLLRYRNLVVTLQTLLPAIIAAVFILAGWSLSGQAISFLHLVGFLLAVAICVDYGIFYRENRGGNIVLTYQAMAASMLTSALAFGSLAVANTSSLQTLAQVVACGVILGFLLCPVIIKQPAEKTP